MPTAATLRLDGPSLRVVRAYRLRVTDGPDRGKVVEPRPCPIEVGTAASSGLVLSDPAVSRFHFALEVRPYGPVIVDRGSTNGTWLGGYAVREASLPDRAVVRLGETEVEITTDQEPHWETSDERSSFGGLVGVSPALRALFSTLERLAAAEAAVLIDGETGTGKELVARALHEQGPRRDAPFVVVDCGAAAPNLIESELFGHERGAFTGAEQARTGALSAAHGGTLFLDEIGELPLALQPKLLRALEAGTVKPLGAESERAVEFRVVAATHRDLRQMVNEGRFREDLYYRLAVFPVRLPPLRERVEDIRPLTRHFLHHSIQRSGGVDQPEPSEESVRWLERQPWPGNVRELRNAVERAVVLGNLDELARGDLVSSLRSLSQRPDRPGSTVATLSDAKRRFEQDYLLALLDRHGWDAASAAKEADIHVKSLQRLIRRYGLRRGPTS